MTIEQAVEPIWGVEWRGHAVVPVAYIAATPRSPRALPAAEPGKYLKRFGRPVTVCAGSAQAAGPALAHTAPEKVICAAGSLDMAGAIRTHLRRENHENSGH